MQGNLNWMPGYNTNKERGDSVVECLTRDQGVAGSSLTGGTVSLSMALYPLLSTGSTQEDKSRHNYKNC